MKKGHKIQVPNRRTSGVLPYIVLLIVTSLLFCACFGIKSDVLIRGNGSGTLSMEYRIAEKLLKLGTQDGNENFPVIPVGQEDFKRTVDRIEGLELKAFSSKKENEDIIYQVKIEYSTLSALAQFMNTHGGVFEFRENNGLHILNIIFSSGRKSYQFDTNEFFPAVFKDYAFDFKISFPKKCDVIFLNAGAQRIEKPSYGAIKIGSKSFEFAAAMSEILTAEEALTLEISW
ncbi:MAG: hypothetical protein LBV68_08850 [Spirochaetaceae bacterium]|jgi:hypothetical protein|nr:hypothetical protein [Spirochaetaceae bacterium]